MTVISTTSPLPRLDSAIHEKIAIGTTAIVYALNETQVVKKYFKQDEQYDIELRAYSRLGSHPYIAHFFGCTPDGIVLERGTCLRKILQVESRNIPLKRKLRWATQLAKGLRYIHSEGIVSADVGTKNVIVDSDDSAKHLDFGGCGMDGKEPISCYEWCYYRRSIPSTSLQTDIFAFGCTLFEIETGRPPYHELQEHLTESQCMDEVEARYSRNEFPSVCDLVLGDVIIGCWKQRYQSMSTVEEMLDTIFADKMDDADERNATGARWLGWISQIDTRFVEQLLKRVWWKLVWLYQKLRPRILDS